MNDWTGFGLAVLALLITPGPTNTLMAAAGAQRGVLLALPLLTGEVGGYLIAVTLWTELVGVALVTHPWVPAVAKLAAAAFLFWSAWKLWVNPGPADLEQRGVTLSRVFVTTLINPKALVFAFAIFPTVSLFGRLPYLGVFAALIITTAVGWMALGAFAAHSLAGLVTSSRIERLTALALAVFGTVLAIQTMVGIL